jgi:phosphonate transport system permease protein
MLGPRRVVLLAILLMGCVAVWQLDLHVRDLLPSQAGANKAFEFFGAALAPALTYETPPPLGTEALLLKVAKAIWKTIAFAVVAVGLAAVAGMGLSFLASSAWWEDDLLDDSNRTAITLRHAIALAVLWVTRSIIVFARSIHELMWAMLFLSAMGLNTLTAILAIAIPFTGVFAKVFSEIIDESSRDAARALRSLGATPIQVFLFGLLPRALPDMTAYACYRLECGIRSSAVMGFFGIMTLGYHLQPAFDEQHYGEVWTYLYALLLLVVLVDLWSSAMRRRLAT